MAQSKTKRTDASVKDFIASRANEQQRSGCRELMALLKTVTRQPPRMWGPSIVDLPRTGRVNHEQALTGRPRQRQAAV
jgi:hypothetical protein